MVSCVSPGSVFDQHTEVPRFELLRERHVLSKLVTGAMPQLSRLMKPFGNRQSFKAAIFRMFSFPGIPVTQASNSAEYGSSDSHSQSDSDMLEMLADDRRRPG